MEPQTGHEIQTWHINGGAGHPRFHPYLPILASTVSLTNANELRFWRLNESPGDHAEDHMTTPPLLAVAIGKSNMSRIAFSPDGAYFAGNNGFGVRLWQIEELLNSDAPHQRALELAGHTYHCTDVRFSPDSSMLVSCSTDRTIRVWDVNRCFDTASRSENRRIDPLQVSAPLLTGPSAGLQCVTFDATGGLICAGDDDGVVWVWKHERLLTASTDENQKYWSLVNTLRGHSGQIMGIDPLPDGRILTSATDTSIRVWNPLIEDLPRFRNHRTSVVSVKVTPDGKFAISGDGSYAMVVWDIETGAAISRVANPKSGRLRDLTCWVADGMNFVAAAYRNNNDYTHGRLVVWKLDDRGRPSLSFEYFGVDGAPTSSPGFHSVAVTQDGHRLAAGDSAGVVHVLQLDDGARQHTATAHRVHDSHVLGVAFLDATGQWLAATSGLEDYTSHSEKNTIRICKGDTGVPIGDPLPTVHQNSVCGIDVRLGSASGGQLNKYGVEMATSSADGLVCLWDVDWTANTPRVTLREALKGHQGAALAVAFHPNQPRLASAGYDRTVRIWDTEGLAEIVALRGAKGSLCDAAFDPTGRRLLTACSGMTGADNAVLLWDSDYPVDIASRNRRASFARWRTNIRDAIQAGNELTQPTFLLDQYAGFIDQIAAMEQWPDGSKGSLDICTYARDHFTAYIHNVTAFTKPAWNIVCDPTCELQFQQAHEHALEATKLDPWNILAYTTLGAACFRLGHLSDAIEALNRPHTLAKEATIAEEEKEFNNPPPPRPELAFLAMAHARLGQFDKAIEALNGFRESLTMLEQGPEHDCLILLENEAERIVAKSQ